MNQTPPSASPNASSRVAFEKAAYVLAIVFAVFETIIIHSALTGALSIGAVQGLVISGGILAFLISRIRSADARREVFARVALGISVIGVVGALLLSGKLAQMRGVARTSGPSLQTVLLLTFQLGLALTFWLDVTKRQRGQARYIPSAIGVVVLIGGGFLAGREAPPAVAEEAGGVVYKQFASAEDYAFAHETQRVGDETGSVFAHYHSGRQPLIGLSLDTRDWFGRTRISEMNGIFEHGEEAAGAHRIEARPGYVVASVEVVADDHVNAIRVEFAPFDGEFLTGDGWYWSEWVGSHQRGSPATRLDGGTELIVGVRGASGLVLNSLSLLTASPAGVRTDG